MSTSLLSWRTYLPLFLIWIVAEDLVRKLTGGNIFIYFAKDLLVLWMYALFFLSKPRRLFRWPKTRYLAPILLLLVIALAQAFNPGIPDQRIALLGLRNIFIYVPLLLIGYEYLRNRADLERLITLMASLSIVASLVGITQALVDPAFLNPEGLGEYYRFNIVRGTTHRVTSVFIDYGRYAYYLLFMFFILFGGVLYAYRVGMKASRRYLLTVALILVMAGILTCGSRAPIVAMGIGLLVITISSSPLRTLQVGIGIAVIIVILLMIEHKGAVNALNFVDSHVLNLDSWYDRVNHLAKAYASPALVNNFWFGTGTGMASQGTRYLLGKELQGAPESALAAVIMMFGVIVAPVWLWLNAGWVATSLRIHRLARRGIFAALSRNLLTLNILYVAIINLLGYQMVENFITITHFWLFNGMALKLTVMTPQYRTTVINETQARDADMALVNLDDGMTGKASR